MILIHNKAYHDLNLLFPTLTLIGNHFMKKGLKHLQQLTNFVYFLWEYTFFISHMHF